MLKIIIPTCLINKGLLLTCINSIISSIPIKDYEIHTVVNNYKGYAKAVNKALRTADSDVLLLNDDALLVPGWYEAIQEVLKKDPDIGLVGDSRGLRKCHRTGAVHFSFFFAYITKPCLEAVGILDERFNVGECEDIDYCIRAKFAGFKLATIKLRMFHNHSQTISQLNKEQKKEIAKNKMRLVKKWKALNKIE